MRDNGKPLRALFVLKNRPYWDGFLVKIISVKRHENSPPRGSSRDFDISRRAIFSWRALALADLPSISISGDLVGIGRLYETIKQVREALGSCSLIYYRPQLNSWGCPMEWLVFFPFPG